MQRGIFIVWKGYQRRAEVIAPKLQSEIWFIPHRFRRKMFRPVDYLDKLFISCVVCWRHKPSFIVAQSPPLYSALAAWLCRIPYILDAHNPVFQNVGGKVSWGKLPLSGFLIKQAKAVIVHNHGILAVAQKAYPEVTFFNIPDPLAVIAAPTQRDRQQIFVICSFDPDEPVAILLDSIAQLPDFTFVITADALKLPPTLKAKLDSLPNVRMTGFLPIPAYHACLCSSAAALVLTSQNLIQPSGACEALSSNTPLIISDTPLIRELFGDWGILVENSAVAIVDAIRQLDNCDRDLSAYRNAWNAIVDREIAHLMDFWRESSTVR